MHPDFSLLKGLDWIEAPNSRDLDGKIAGAWGALSNHVGTLFGHMYQWQLAKDSMNKATIIVDSDGLAPDKARGAGVVVRGHHRQRAGGVRYHLTQHLSRCRELAHGRGISRSQRARPQAHNLEIARAHRLEHLHNLVVVPG